MAPTTPGHAAEGARVIASTGTAGEETSVYRSGSDCVTAARDLFVDAIRRKWHENVLLVRRSQTVGDEVMETTKTKKRQKLFFPSELLDVLRWHVDHQIPEDIRARTDLLFPSETGGFRAASALKVPF